MNTITQAVWLSIVAFLWGSTNPLLKYYSKGVESVGKKGKLPVFIAEFLFLFSNVKYLLSFLLNQSGSILYYITLANADLTLAVPISNSLTFIFTAISSRLLFKEEYLNLETICGMFFIVTGVMFCVLGKAE